MVYKATITPKCSICSVSTLVYVYYGETTSEYHKINFITKYAVLEEEEEI